MEHRKKSIHSKPFLDGIIINTEETEIIYNRSQGKIIKSKFRINNKILLNIPIIRGNIKIIKHIILFIKSLNCTLDNMEEELKEKDISISNTEKKVIDKLKINPVQLLFFIALILGSIFSLLVFIFIPSIIVSFISSFLKADILLSIIEGSLRLLTFFGFIKMTHKIPEFKRLYMYHGAEHKYLNCIKNNKEINFNNVKKSEKYYLNCVTYNLYKFAVIVILYFSFFAFDGSYVANLTMRILLIPVILGIAYELKVLFADNKKNISKFGKFIQDIFIEEPSDEVVRIIMNAMKEIDIKENC